MGAGRLRRGELAPAAQALASLHDGAVRRTDIGDAGRLRELLRQAAPRQAAFVLSPERIDVDLAHRVLEAATQLDDDPFVDVEYGFITGRDGAAALRFACRAGAATERTAAGSVALFGSWEGVLAPPTAPLTAMKALGLDASERYVMARAEPTAQRKAASEALAGLGGRDALLFLSHGYPTEMSACFRAADLREWKVDLAPAVLVNCACYNGAPGKWYAPGPGGVEEKPPAPAEDSVALALLDAGVSAYVAGVDPWHGPLAMQYFHLIAGDGMRLGEAAKCMFDRLALDFAPEKLRFAPAREVPERFAGEGRANRRHNGAGMIVYGDPAFAPFSARARRVSFAEVSDAGGGRERVRLGFLSLVDGKLGGDFMVPLSALTNYYSVRGPDAVKDLTLEVHRVLPLTPGAPLVPSLRVLSARAGKRDVPVEEPELAVEESPDGRRLHVRLPIAVKAYGTHWAQTLARAGLTVELEGDI